MQFVNCLFQENYWAELSKKTAGEKGLLSVPRTRASSATSVGVNSFTTARFEEVLQEVEMGGLELALREVEGVQCLIEDKDRRERKKRRSMDIPRGWLKKMGRKGGVRPSLSVLE
jgi:hypothetical protein